MACGCKKNTTLCLEQVEEACMNWNGKECVWLSIKIVGNARASMCGNTKRLLSGMLQDNLKCPYGRWDKIE